MAKHVFAVKYVAPGTVLAVLALSVATPATADVFHLAGGGQIVGRETTEDSSRPELISIELADGGRVQILRSSLEKQERTSDELDEYQRRARSVGSTVEAQWELAEWCRARGLKQQRAVHLQRILELDPDHVPARRGLGYFQLQGKWVTREQAQQRDGYVLYEGRWRTRQEVQLRLERKALRAAQIEWTKRLKRWRLDIVSGKPHEAQQAHDSFLEIDDPLAIDPLVRLICTERIRELKLFYVRVLCRIADPRAVHQLTYLTLVDRDDDVFDLCIREVVSRQQPETVKTYVQALKNVDNFCVNRAAFSLLHLNDVSAIGPLIEALVTVHPVRTPPQTTPGGLPASESTITFALDDSGQSTPFSERRLPPIVLVQVANHDVLAALVELSGGKSFGFNQEAWRRWNAAMRQQMPTVATSREGP
jgi:hypothetical protein